VRGVGGIFQFIMFGALLLISGNVFAQEAAAPRGPIITRQTRMYIPFVNAPENSAQELQLYVSTDGGDKWTFYARSKPSAGQFEFVAPEDGPYWFALFTVTNSSGPPPTTFKSELQINVDTSPPRIDFAATAGSAGEVRANWAIIDPNLDADSILIEYQSVGQNQWREVAIDPSQSQSGKGQATGAVAWLPRTGSRVVGVRMTASDKAGNPSVVNRRVYLPLVAKTKMPEAIPGVVSPPATVFDDRNTDNNFAQKQAPSTPWPADFHSETTATDPRTPLNATTSPETAIQESIAGRWAPQPAVPSPVGQPVANRMTAPASRDANAWKPPSSIESNGTQNIRTQDIRTQDTRTQDTSKPQTVPVSSASPQPIERATNAAQSPSGAQMTNDTKFNLEYDVESVGSGGVKRVELWVTKDNGATWDKYGEDLDRESPFEVEALGDGYFGYSIVVASRSGRSSRAPRPGEQPDVTIGVDRTAPIVKITAAPLSRGPQGDEMRIEWRAQDMKLANQPITISYAESLQGPWSIMASSIPNSGSYTWRINQDAPNEIYLRVSARDAAANIGSDTLTQPISLEGLVPKARIRGLSPRTGQWIPNPFMHR